MSRMRRDMLAILEDAGAKTALAWIDALCDLDPLLRYTRPFWRGGFYAELDELIANGTVTAEWRKSAFSQPILLYRLTAGMTDAGAAA